MRALTFPGVSEYDGKRDARGCFNHMLLLPIRLWAIDQLEAGDLGV